MPRYSNDPRWIIARYDGFCRNPVFEPDAVAGHECGNMIERGERVYYYPLTKSVYCVECSPAVARAAELELAADDRGAGRP